MNNIAKIYPVTGFIAPHEKLNENGTQIHRPVYSSYAKGIINDNEIEAIVAMLEKIGDTIEDDHCKEELEMIWKILQDSEERMDNLHSVLGAFNMDEHKRLSKPDSERIDWTDKK